MNRIEHSLAKARRLQSVIRDDIPKLQEKNILHQLGNGEYICKPYRGIFIWDEEDWEKWKKEYRLSQHQEGVA